MKIPKRITELLKRKESLIESADSNLEKSVIRLQVKLYDKMIRELLPDLDVVDGVIQDTNKNYRIISGMDKIYTDFLKEHKPVLMSEFIKTTTEINALTNSYFKVVLNESMLKRFEKIVEATTNKMNLRLGVKGGSSVSGGFIDSIVSDRTLGLQVKNYVVKSVTGQIDSKEFIKGLGEMINGKPADKYGGLEKQFQRYAYDLYQQYDRSYNNAIADEFEMKYFLYQGGIISTTRDFCAAHNNKVWSREESEEWPVWMPYMGQYPEGYEVKQKDIYDIPSYLGYAGYQPLIDGGGFRCRHTIAFIPTELAEELRPELKGENKS